MGRENFIGVGLVYAGDKVTLERFGIQWNGPKSTIATEMNDGYWTPWHIANDIIMKLQIEVNVQSYWGRSGK